MNGGGAKKTLRVKKFANRRKIVHNSAMANTKQSAKRARQADNRRARGQMLRTRYRTNVKRARAALQNGDVGAAKKAFAVMQESADKTAGKGIIHANAAARTKSRLHAQLKVLSASGGKKETPPQPAAAQAE